MDPFHAALLAAALFVALLARHEPRAWLWLAAGATSFTATALYEAWGLGFHPVVTGLFDAVVCLTIYFVASQRWEMWLYRIFRVSVLVSLLRAAGLIEDHTLYIIALEACNWTALVVIGSGAVGGLVDDRVGTGWPPGDRLRRALVALRSPRATPPLERR